MARWGGLLYAVGLLSAAGITDAFYLPGKAPNSYADGEKVCSLQSSYSYPVSVDHIISQTTYLTGLVHNARLTSVYGLNRYTCFILPGGNAFEGMHDHQTKCSLCGLLAGYSSAAGQQCCTNYEYIHPYTAAAAL